VQFNTCAGTVVKERKNVFLGIPASPGQLLQSISPLCVNSEKYASIASVAGATSYSWKSNSVNLDLGTPCGTTSCADGLNNLVGGYAVGTFSFTIKANNSCGSSLLHTYNVGVVSCGGGGTNNLSIYPNPTTSDLTVEYVLVIGEPSNNVTNSTNEEFYVELFDSNNQLSTSAMSEKGKITLNVRNLPKGVYFLRVTNDEGSVTKQIIID
jgi:hypothetical protein